MEIRSLQDFEAYRKSLLSPEDKLYLLAGKLSMSWAKIEQGVDSGIDMLRREMGWAGVPVNEAVPDYFRKRAAYLLRLICNLSPDLNVHKQARQMFGTIRRMKKVREAIAHGEVRERHGRLHIRESLAKRTAKGLKGQERRPPIEWLHTPPADEGKVWDFSLGPSMPFARFEEDVECIQDISTQLQRLARSAYHGFREKHPDLRFLAFLEAAGRAPPD